MKLLGYEINKYMFSPEEQEEQDDLWIIPVFGISWWTFNNSKYSYVLNTTKEKEKGLHVHFWVFKYRFDLEFRKTFKA